MLLKVDLNDSWAKIEISIVACKLPNEKYDFDWNRCQFGNFANVPTTGWCETENQCDICVFYQWMKGIKHIIHNLCTLWLYTPIIHIFYCDNHCIMLLLCSKSPIFSSLRGTSCTFCTSQLHWVRSLLFCCSSNIWNVRRVKHDILILECPAKVLNFFWIKVEPSSMAKCIIIR